MSDERDERPDAPEEADATGEVGAEQAAGPADAGGAPDDGGAPDGAADRDRADGDEVDGGGPALAEGGGDEPAVPAGPGPGPLERSHGGIARSDVPRDPGAARLDEARRAAGVTLNPNQASGEYRKVHGRPPVVGLDDRLREVRERVLGAFDGLDSLAARGELTVIVPAELIHDVVRFCRDDEVVACEVLVDLAGVHWPGGTVRSTSASTTGWPAYEGELDGAIEVAYLLRSVAGGHRLRLRTTVPDDQPRLPSVTDLYRAAGPMEREVYDMLGVDFDGHPSLTRILMPEEWEGHPHRKDYPLGGVEVQYRGHTIPPPDERGY